MPIQVHSVLAADEVAPWCALRDMLPSRWCRAQETSSVTPRRYRGTSSKTWLRLVGGVSVPLIRTSWQLSAMIVVLLVCAGVELRWFRHPRLRPAVAFSQEFAVFFALITVWQYVGRFVHTQVDGAFEHALGVVRLTRALHLPDEAWVQGLVLPHPGLVRVMNLYYSGVHFNSLWVFFLWLWWRHRAQFRRARTLVALSTLGCLLLQAVPVAPPRMFPELGFVDTALQYGQSVYGAGGSGVANQLAAMPSVHVLWAVMICVTVVRVSPSRWRWLVALHLPVTVLVVVATANHWWLDGVVAALVLAGAAGAIGGIRWVAGALRAAVSRAAAPEPTRVP